MKVPRYSTTQLLEEPSHGERSYQYTLVLLLEKYYYSNYLRAPSSFSEQSLYEPTLTISVNTLYYDSLRGKRPSFTTILYSEGTPLQVAPLFGQPHCLGSITVWAVPLFGQPKTDGHIRLFADLASQNFNPIKEFVKIPNQKQILKAIARAKCCSKIDLHDAYF